MALINKDSFEHIKKESKELLENKLNNLDAG